MVTEDAKPSHEVAVRGSDVHTFLIADVRGYTRFTVEHGDEAAAALAGRFADLVGEAVAEREGEVIELRGDEALAVFSSARQAIRAAAELQGRFMAASSDPSMPMKVGIGLDAGEAIAVKGGYRGAALNLAARLCSLAGPGEVLASDGVIHLARKVEGIEYVERGAVQLKGFSEPVRVIRVMPARERGVSQPEEDEQLLPIGGFLGALPSDPLVAREDELRRVLGFVDVVAGGSGRLVTLVGEPGVGKTRLAQEVTLAARNRDFIIATGRCYEPRESVPYYPFLEALAVAYASAPSTVRASVSQRWLYLAPLLPEDAGLARVALGEGQEEQERLFRAVTGFLLAIAEITPIALLLDDLHWADGSSLELLQHLARHTRAHRVLLLGTYRDVEVNRRHPLGRMLRDLHREQLLEEVAVRRLGLDGTTALMAAVFDEEITPEFADLVHRHTEGNPFFTHEVLHALIERGDVYRKEDAWERRSVEDIEVPKSVREAVGEHLTRLTEDAQELLRQASVLGQTCRFDDLLAMSGRAEEEVEGLLQEAADAGLVREIDRDEYGFNHALTQQTLYEELSGRRKRRLHLAAGEVLDALPPRKREGRIAELAWHFLEGDDPERALVYALLAGDQAETIYAHAEAERHYRAGLQLSRELEDRERETEALERLGRVLRLTGRADEALGVLEEAMERARAKGNTERTASIAAEIGNVHIRSGPEAVIAYVQPFIEEMEGMPPSRGLGSLYEALAVALVTTSRYAEVAPIGEKMVEISRALGDDELLALGTFMYGTGVFWSAGRYEEGKEALEDAVALAERINMLDPLRLANAGLGEAHLVAGDFAQTLACWQRQFEVSEQVGEPWQIGFAHVNLAEIGYHLGNWHEARTEVDLATSYLPTASNAFFEPYPELFAGILDLSEGKVESGIRRIEAGIAVAERNHDLQALRRVQNVLAELDLLEGRPQEAWARLEPLLDRPGTEEENVTRLLPTLARAYLDSGREEKAEETLDRAAERAAREGSRLTEVEILIVRGMVLARQGRRQEATEAFAGAIELARAMPHPYAEGRAFYWWGYALMESGELDVAGEKLREALAIFERLGAGLYGERARRALEGMSET